MAIVLDIMDKCSESTDEDIFSHEQVSLRHSQFPRLHNHVRGNCIQEATNSIFFHKAGFGLSFGSLMVLGTANKLFGSGDDIFDTKCDHWYIDG